MYELIDYFEKEIIHLNCGAFLEKFKISEEYLEMERKRLFQCIGVLKSSIKVD